MSDSRSQTSNHRRTATTVCDGDRVVNMRLESMQWGERPRQILRLLDGRHCGPHVIADAKAAEQTLRGFARLALLVA